MNLAFNIINKYLGWAWDKSGTSDGNNSLSMRGNVFRLYITNHRCSSCIIGDTWIYNTHWIIINKYFSITRIIIFIIWIIFKPSSKINISNLTSRSTCSSRIYKFNSSNSIQINILIVMFRFIIFISSTMRILFFWFFTFRRSFNIPSSMNIIINSEPIFKGNSISRILEFSSFQIWSTYINSR